MAMCCLNRRLPLKINYNVFPAWKRHVALLLCAVLSCIAWVHPAFAQATNGPVRITLDEAIQLAIQHNHFLIAMRTTIQQSESEEITQGSRPNPTLFADWEYLPVFGSPASQNPDLYAGQTTNTYLKNNTEGDI